jgi:TPR repeat protein
MIHEFVYEHRRVNPRKSWVFSLNLTQAHKFYRLSAQHGNTEARCCFGICLEISRNVAQIRATEFDHLCVQQELERGVAHDLVCTTCLG